MRQSKNGTYHKRKWTELTSSEDDGNSSEESSGNASFDSTSIGVDNSGVDNSDDDNSDDDNSLKDFIVEDEVSTYSILVDNLRKHIPEVKDVPNSRLEFAIGKFLKEAYQNIMNEENDDNWKAECNNEKEIEMFETELEKINSKIKSDQLTLPRILRETMPFNDKIEIVKMFKILLNMDYNGIDYYEYDKEIKRKIKRAVSIPINEIEAINKEQERLKTKQPPSDYELKRKIYYLDADDSVKAKLYDMHNDLINLNRDNSEYSTLKGKLLWAISLPHRKMAITPNDLIKDTNALKNYCSDVYKNLDKHLYGMKKVKERLMQTVLNRIYNPKAKSMLGLSSPPGRGKTAIASALAKSLNLPFERISLGGMEDPSIFKGTDNSWVGSSPSIILHILRRMKVSNGIVLFDEIDKLSTSQKGKEIQYALLHITDYIQNKEFHDLFLSEIPHNLSNIWFMFAMNNDDWLDPALRDRLDIVHVDSYSKDDIIQIIKRHFLPAAAINSGLKAEDIDISEGACKELRSILSEDMSTDGLRAIEREITNIVSKINLYNVLRYGDTINLSFSVPDFNGFPYKIKINTIDKLVERKKINPSYLKMYM